MTFSSFSFVAASLRNGNGELVIKVEGHGKAVLKCCVKTKIESLDGFYKSSFYKSNSKILEWSNPNYSIKTVSGGEDGETCHGLHIKIVSPIETGEYICKSSKNDQIIYKVVIAGILTSNPIWYTMV